MAKDKTKYENNFIPQRVKILDHITETNDDFTLKLDIQLKHEPGQFVQVGLLGIGECPVSISSYSQDYVRLNIRKVGNVTNALSKLKKGDSVFLRGPYGRGYPMHYFKGNNLIIIGGGCGVAPLRGIIEYVEKNRNDFKDIHMFFGFRTPEDILFKKELEKWKTIYNLKISVDKAPSKSKVCLDGKIGFVAQLLEEQSISNENKIVFICGPPVMIKSVVDVLRKKGFNDDQIYISAERLMFCGFGVCCHCMIHGKFTCKDGPVFRYDEISHYEND